MLHLSAKRASFIGVFAALHVILYFLSFGLWRNWAIYLEPVEGVILGPWAGFFAAFVGSVLARTIKPIDLWMFGIVASPWGFWLPVFSLREGGSQLWRFMRLCLQRTLYILLERSFHSGLYLTFCLL
jgi:hypothetical protein